MEETKAGSLQSTPPPVAKRVFEGLTSGSVSRHVPDVDKVEPKVFVPYKWTPGLIPRRIEVERKKRQFADVDLSQVFKENGVLEELRVTFA